MYDLIVIGGGPAGLTATMYALRKRLNVLLVTNNLGGKTNLHLKLPWIEDYQVIRGLEIVNKFRNELEYLEFARFFDDVELVKHNPNGDGFLVITKNNARLETRTVIAATGTSQKLLEVPGEHELMMRGLCYSTLSYAPLFIDRATAVVGDGDLALRSAAELATIASQVYLVMRNGEALDSPLGKKLRNAVNVQIIEGVRVISVECEPTLAGAGNGSAKEKDHYARCLGLEDGDGQISHLAVDGIFVELGLRGNSEMFKQMVVTDADGRIRVDSNCHTSQPGIFAAGDVTTIAGEQVLVAIGEGAKAALNAYDYLLPIL